MLLFELSSVLAVVELLENFDFNHSLQHELRLVLDDLDGVLSALVDVDALDHLAEGALA